MPPSTSLAILKNPSECSVLTTGRMAELRERAERLIASKESPPHLLTSCLGVAHFVELTEPKLLTFGGEETEDTKIGYSLLFVIRPELLGPAGIEQFYSFICSINAMNQRYFGGKADRVFLREGEGDEMSVKPFGSYYINMKKGFPQNDPNKLPKPPKVYAADAKTIIPASSITEGSLIRARIYCGPPSKAAYGKTIWGGTPESIQLVQANEGNIATIGVEASLEEDAPPEDDADSITRYASLRAEALPAPEPNPGGDTGGGDMDDDIPF